jgi:mannose/fructose/N-acetylgalactosamine-specific phosphotransferase system component IIC
MTYTLVDMQFADMIAESVDYKKIKFLLMIFAFCWAIVCLIIGVTVIVGMKRQYLK